jgi:septal ring factor EnvC (AmiA/AmiB activator)
MRALLVLAVPLLIAASAPVLPEGESIDAALKRATAEAAASDARGRQLEQAAGKARDDASRMRARQAAAAEAIAAAEARISAADAQVRLIAANLAIRRATLREQQRPVSALLGGLVMMARRPPLLAIADERSTQELVRVRILLDSTLPVIRRRTAALAAELAGGQRLALAAEKARSDLLRSRNELTERRREFAALESEALRRAESYGGEALSVGDVALASGEAAERLAAEVQGGRSGTQLAADLAQLGPAPSRPVPPEGKGPVAPFAYLLPSNAPVIEGVGSVSPSGVRARGLTLATDRGDPVIVPALGTVRFAGPFRDYDGVVIIDHGGGWMSLIVNVSSSLRTGTRVRLGEPLGRALGRLGVELSKGGDRVSPALIAGSSGLSNASKPG